MMKWWHIVRHAPALLHPTDDPAAQLAILADQQLVLAQEMRRTIAQLYKERRDDDRE